MVITTSISTSVKPPRCQPSAAMCRAVRFELPTKYPPMVSSDIMMNLPLVYPTSCVTDSSAVMTDTIRPPTTVLMVMIASGPTMPTMRSRLRCNFAS